MSFKLTDTIIIVICTAIFGLYVTSILNANGEDEIVWVNPEVNQMAIEWIAYNCESRGYPTNAEWCQQIERIICNERTVESPHALNCEVVRNG